jgi:hypothetical protein
MIINGDQYEVSEQIRERMAAYEGPDDSRDKEGFQSIPTLYSLASNLDYKLPHGCENSSREKATDLSAS